jgi:hypothetical protein
LVLTDVVVDVIDLAFSGLLILDVLAAAVTEGAECSRSFVVLLDYILWSCFVNLLVSLILYIDDLVFDPVLILIITLLFQRNLAALHV